MERGDSGGRFGRLPMDRVLAPAIGYARDGFPVSELIAFYWERNVRAFAVATWAPVPGNV